MHVILGQGETFFNHRAYVQVFNNFVITSIFLPLISSAIAAESPPPLKAADASIGIDLSGYVMTFHDEFDGTALDTTKWEAPTMPRQGGSRWTSEQVSVQNGCLRLGIQLTNDPVLRYDCGAVRTRRNYDINQTMFVQAYGYFEARCKLPRRIDADYFADFWIMAGKITEGNNTREGNEIDIFESFELAEGRQYSMNFHWSGYGRQHNVYGLKCGNKPQLRDGKFHVYGFLWTKEFYAVYVDGVEIGRTAMMGLGSNKDGKLLSNGPCQEPGYLKLTVEAAQWAGKSPGWEPDLPTQDEFLIDWVRAYLPKPKATPIPIADMSVSPTRLIKPAQSEPVQLTPTPEGLSAFDDRLHQRIRALVAVNKGPQFLMHATHSLARITQADDNDGLVLMVSDSELTWRWSRLDLADRCRLALACARSNHPGDAADNAFWLFATGQRVEAERQLVLADATGIVAVRAAFSQEKPPVATVPVSTAP
jgi:beta-glucanase (GH16 family)